MGLLEGRYFGGSESGDLRDSVDHHASGRVEFLLTLFSSPAVVDEARGGVAFER
jgi:hypothetical protein